MVIENQAMIFAFFSKHAISICGEDGRKMIQLAMTQYGNERGIRMAKRAVNHGDPIALWTNQTYGEWKPDYDGQMEFGIECGEPTLRTYITKCAWCEAWKKNDILEYGKEYCVNVDNAVYQGFCSEYKCDSVGAQMSWGGEKCVFDWNQPLSEEDMKKMAERKAEIGTSCMKDFDYHTAHMYFSLCDTIHDVLPEYANEIITKAVDDYVALFGQEDFDRILEFEAVDFTDV